MIWHYHRLQYLLSLGFGLALFLAGSSAEAREPVDLVSRFGKLVSKSPTEVVLEVPNNTGRRRIAFAVNEKADLGSAMPGDMVTVIYAHRKPKDVVVRLKVEHPMQGNPSNPPLTPIETLGVASAKDPSRERALTGAESEQVMGMAQVIQPKTEPDATLMSDGKPVNSGTVTQTETRLTGCIVDEMLEDANGRFYILNNASQFAAHNGEEVVVHGTTANSSGTLDLPLGAGAHPVTSRINVAIMDIVSDKCKLVIRHSKPGKDHENPLGNLSPDRD